MQSLNLSEALLISLLGIVVVFAVLVIIMWFIQLLGKVVGAAAKKEAPKPAPAPVAAAPVAAAPVQTAAPTGPVMSDGRIQLNTVSDRTAAMLMAIVADATGLPLDQLEFVSVKEIGPAEGE